MKGSFYKASPYFVCKCCTAVTLATDKVDNDELDIGVRILLERIGKFGLI